MNRREVPRARRHRPQDAANLVGTKLQTRDNDPTAVADIEKSVRPSFQMEPFSNGDSP